jgi:hypothetical protein
MQPQHARLALTISGAAVALLALWLGAMAWLKPDAATEPITWESLAPPASTPLRSWRHIVLHHSNTRKDTVASIDAAHRRKGWDGIGYHLVIGNGVNMADGAMEPTFRWRSQLHGAHAGSSPLAKAWNDQGIGICLLGKFNDDTPSEHQIERLVELLCVLIRHLPGLSTARIIGHGDVPGKDTDCPGRHLDVERIRFLVRERLAAEGVGERP